MGRTSKPLVSQLHAILGNAERASAMSLASIDQKLERMVELMEYMAQVQHEMLKDRRR